VNTPKPAGVVNNSVERDFCMVVTMDTGHEFKTDSVPMTETALGEMGEFRRSVQEILSFKPGDGGQFNIDTSDGGWAVVPLGRVLAIEMRAVTPYNAKSNPKRCQFRGVEGDQCTEPYGAEHAYVHMFGDPRKWDR
jgi:hypothetical protein